MPDDYRSKMLKRTNVRTTDKFMFFLTVKVVHYYLEYLSRKLI